MVSVDELVEPGKSFDPPNPMADTTPHPNVSES